MTILTAKQGTNADSFSDILSIYAQSGWRILDMTWGKGCFWTNIEISKYQLTRNDINTNADTKYDFRNTEFADSSFDMIILDPPYAYSPGNSMKESIAGCYQNNTSPDISNMSKVLQLYRNGMNEARRVLRTGGILVVKSQDIIQSGKQWWMHKLLMDHDGFICEDLFVLVQKSIPAMDPKWPKQYHARKNHSFFLILKKLGEKK